MGTTITDWAQATGPMYMGANTSWELIWTGVAVALCLMAMISGSRHELDAYKKLRNNSKK